MSFFKTHSGLTELLVAIDEFRLLLLDSDMVKSTSRFESGSSFAVCTGHFWGNWP